LEGGFPALLRSHRLRCQLTQEALAERAGLSARSVRELERGRGRGPQPHTLDRLVGALELAGEARDEFLDTGRALFWAGRSRSPNRAPQPAPAPAAAPVCQLPADLPDFVGRDHELDRLCTALAAADRAVPLAAVSGPPGIGKTALTVRAAHRLAPRFPDGQLFASLRGAGRDPADPAEVLALLLRVLGVDGSALPTGVDARAGLFRSRLQGRRVLLVLDDAGGYHQVAPLLPAGGAAVIVTSRSPLTGLPGVTTMDLPTLSGPAAVELLGRVAGSERVRGEPAASAELVAACGGLPLAVRIAGARLAARPHWTVGTLAGRLADERRRLDELRHGDLAVRPGLQLAYRGLSAAAARAFGLLGALDVPSFPEWPVAALLGAPAADATALEELIDARLIDDLGRDPAGQHRYRFHDVTRLYARECRIADIGQAEWLAALSRAASGWLALARRAQDNLHCDRLHLDDREGPAAVVDESTAAIAADQPVAWFEAEREALAAVVTACAEAGLAATARCMAGCAADFYALRGHCEDWRRTTTAALAGCRTAGDRRGEAAMLRGLGSCLVELSDPAEALSTLRTALALAEQVGDPAGAAMARRDAGFVLGLAGRLDEAEAELRAAAGELALAGPRHTESIALAYLGFVLRQRGRIAEAARVVRSAWAVARSCGDRFAQAYVTRGLAGTMLAGGRAAEAERAARRSAAQFEQIGDPIGAAQSRRILGEAISRDPGRLAEAERALLAAAAGFAAGGHEWGLALIELSLGEIEVRRGVDGAADRLHRSLRYWTDEQVPALQARTLVALGSAAQKRGDPTARDLLVQAYRLYRDLDAPEAAELAARLGPPIP
jgi:tetratricopeptide (TPR) repeat protein/DNA-binding XRE family transcriptional regulator